MSLRSLALLIFTITILFSLHRDRSSHSITKHKQVSVTIFLTQPVKLSTN
jgi:hypothetical protein